MRHPTDGTLRRLVDEPVSVPDADRDHVAGCSVCRSALATVHQDAGVAGTALQVGSTGDLDATLGVDVDDAWRRLSSELAHDARRHAPAARSHRRRALLRPPVLVAVGTAAVLAGASAAAATDWLQIFRAEQVGTPVATRAELVRLPEPEDLAAYGDFRVTAAPNVREVPDAAAAEEVTGLPVPQVADLPRGVAGEPRLLVVDQVGAEFTFSAGEAARTAEVAGEALPPPPPGLDGSRFRLAAGPGQAAIWSGSGSDVPALVVARAVAPTVFSSGLPYEQAVAYLVALPGLPPETASVLGEFAGDGSTLPLPLGTDEVTTTTADVAGVTATVVSSRDGSVSGVVWVADGVVTAVAGSLSDDEVLGVARGLR